MTVPLESSIQAAAAAGRRKHLTACRLRDTQDRSSLQIGVTHTKPRRPTFSQNLFVNFTVTAPLQRAAWAMRYDNAMVESFFASLECELIDRRSFQTKAEARMALFTCIEGWYNPRRRHSALGRISPINFERSHVPNKSPVIDHAIAVLESARIPSG